MRDQAKDGINDIASVDESNISCIPRNKRLNDLLILPDIKLFISTAPIDFRMFTREANLNVDFKFLFIDMHFSMLR